MYLRSWNVQMLSTNLDMMALVQRICVFIILISVKVSLVWLSCPELQPNQNVLVTCLSYDSKIDRYQRVTCEKWPNPGLTVEYQCMKYFTPVSSVFFKGRLHCGENGWIHLKEFEEFRCKPDCGKQPRQSAPYGALISEGKSTKPQSWPWVATIFRSSIKGFVYECGGSLIGLRTVLTAAHCVADGQMNKLPISLLKVGVGNVGSKLAENFEIGGHDDVYSVEDIWIHPDYHAETVTKDIAVIQLAETVRLADSVLPVCLPNTYEDDALATSAGNHGEVASFGSDETGQPRDVLQFGRIPVLSSAKCFRELKMVPRTEEYCAGNDVGPKMCRGDSGAGMVFRSVDLRERKYFVHGIVSNSGPLLSGCARVVVYSRVFTYLHWIRDILRQTEPPLEDIRQNQRKHNITFNDRRKSMVEREQVNCLKQDSICFRPPSSSHRHRQENQPPVHIQNHTPEMPRYTKQELQPLAQLRPMVQDILTEDYMLNDEYLIRFLRTKKFNLLDTKKFLQANMNWRNKSHIKEIRFEDFSKFRKNFPVYIQGYDNGGRPIAIHLLGRYNLKSIDNYNEEGEQFLRYIERNFEEVSWKIRERNASSCFAIFDLLGFNRRQHLCIQCFVIYLHFVTIYENYYPQLCHASYFINVPPVYEQVLNVIQRLFSEQTKKTLKYFGTNKEQWSKALLKQIPRDQLSRIVYGGTKTIVRRGIKDK